MRALGLAAGIVLATSITLPTAACGEEDICEQAREVYKDCPAAGPGASGDPDIGDCVGVVECMAQCVVDHPVSACEQLEQHPNPVRLANFDACLDECLERFP